MKRQSLLLFGGLLLATPAVQAQFNYTTNNGTITITGYTGTNDVVVIPSTINGQPVIGIGDYAFSGSSITGVTIPNSVTSVGDFAFSGCSSLANITLGSGVTSIGVSAFSETDGYGHHYGCPLINVTIPNSVTNIGNHAFAACLSLTNVTIGNSVTSIGAHAFDRCGSLTSVTIPNSVTSIAGYAFADCYGLTKITVDPLNSAYSSVDGVLFNQSQTTLVEYPGGKLGGYTIPNSVTSIADPAFANCTSLTSVTIPNSVTSIGTNAFANCISLTSVTIPNSVTNIGDGAFAGCFSLTSVTIGNSVTSVGDWTFANCFSLTSLYFQGDAPSVGGTNVFRSDKATVHYLPGTTGWGPTFDGIPTALWTLSYPLILNNSLGVQTNQFGFTVSWATNLNVVVEAANDLAKAVWSPVATNALSGGTFYFSDPQWTKYPSRFYRVRSQ